MMKMARQLTRKVRIMSKKKHFTHLTEDERYSIEECIEHGRSKVYMAELIGKDKSTIAREIKCHRKRTYECPLPIECAAYKKCEHNRQCPSDCPDYIPFLCSRRDRSPGACNGCNKYRSCRFNKFRYTAVHAEDEYQTTLKDSRMGADLTTSEAKWIGSIIAPLLKNGLSPYQIIQTHPELHISVRTLYNYIEDDTLHEVAGIMSMDLRRKVSRRISRRKARSYKKRKDNHSLIGRTFKDYLTYTTENPDLPIVQMDTVYNDVTNGPFIQTFKFIRTGLFLAVYHTDKQAANMTQGVLFLESCLGKQLFKKYVPILLTDRGSEFCDADGIEMGSDHTRRTRLFYCDPMRAGQKGSLENSHIELRYIFPKGANLYSLGLTGQDSLNLALSHINSAPIKKLGGKSPLETTKFFYPDLYKKLLSMGIHTIPTDKIILRPGLLKLTQH